MKKFISLKTLLILTSMAVVIFVFLNNYRSHLFVSRLTPSGFLRSLEITINNETQLATASGRNNTTRIGNFREKFLIWNNLKDKVTTSFIPDLNSSKYLIYRCDSGRMSYCGGMADRIKGMIVAYIIANITDRIFKIDLQSPPCNLIQYLVPNLAHWALNTPFHQTLDAVTSDTQIINMMNNRDFYLNINNVNFTKLFGTNKFVYFKANLDYSRGLQNSTLYANKLSWMNQLTPHQIQATIFKCLFNLSPILHSRLHTLLSLELPTSEHKLICAQIRTGRNPSMPAEEPIRLTLDDLPHVWKFLKQHSTSDLHKLFIMTDSEVVLRMTGLQDFGGRLIKTPGIIGHVELSQNLKADKCEAMKKVIFDLHVLMNCDVLLVSNSGLSRLAAYVRGSDVGLYCLRKQNGIIPCNMSDLKNIYNVMGK